MTLELIDVHKSYRVNGGRKTVLRGVNVAIRKGQSVGVMGRNGAGKSTLVRIIGGIEAPSAGTVRRGMSVSFPIGFGGGMQPSLTGADNVRFVARIYGKPVDRTLGFVESFAEIGEYMRMPVASYSAGMRGRLSFAISLALEFDCYLIDEAVAAGDARFNARFREALAERVRRSALVMVSHSPSLIRSYCKTAAVLDGGVLTVHEDLDEAIATYHAL
jgi:capsular polysaccharide transport system ATP-binding protein